jgi:hypothetical protein
MNKIIFALTLCSFSLAHAQAPAPAEKKPAAADAKAPAADAKAPAGGDAMAAMMAMTKPGPEQDALKPFAHNVTSTGSVVAGGMAPGSPEMPTKGKATCKWITGNMWVSCDIEEGMGTGPKAMKWLGHWVFGYDNMAKAYRGVMSDNFGMMERMTGKLDGAKLTWESIDEMKIPNMPSKSRITLDATDPKAIKFTEEVFQGGKWTVHATATHKVAAK